MKFTQWISLNSAAAVRQDDHNKHEKFEIKINPALDLRALKDAELKIALTAFHGCYSWHNIREEYGNNEVRFSCDNGRTFKKVVLPNGLYSYEDLSSHISRVLTVACNEALPFVIKFSTTTYKVSLTVAQNVVVDFTHGEFGGLLGFKKVLLKEGLHESPLPPNLSHDLDNIYVHCDLIDKSLVDGVWDDVIYIFPTAGLIPGYSFTFKETILQFSPLSKLLINSIRIYITDVFGNIISLNNAPITVQLLIKE